MKNGLETSVKFTKEMKKKYTILAPTMLPIHFGLIRKIIEREGYNLEFCEENTKAIITEGLKSVHNDICYPAMLVIGQLMTELKSGKYDINQTALMITQTGGGCRASNYIYLLRKALKENELEQVPVISLNLNKVEKHPGFKLGIRLLVKLVFAMYYGDLLMCIYNQSVPYEKNKGESKALLEKWIAYLGGIGNTPKFLLKNRYYKKILGEFQAIARNDEEKVRVGIVGEIYMKYAPLGNNHLEDYLLKEGVEVVVSGVGDFILYCFRNRQIDKDLYGSKGIGFSLSQLGYWYVEREQKKLIQAIKKYSHFREPTPFKKIEKLVEGYIGLGVKMGEGWLLTAEMLELIDGGVENIVCTQPFGCLPNHIVAKGMIRKIKESHPEANIVAIDYDPSATRVNQENRIKLMLANSSWRNKDKNLG